MTNAGRTWAGTHTFQAPTLVPATSIDEVQRVIARGGRVRALGTRHSFTDLADTRGTLVSVTGIRSDPELDTRARTVTVGAGTRYGEIGAWLDARGWALHNTGSLPHISVGGAIVTGTHGSGDTQGILATAVRAFEYVGADGERTTVRRGEADFDALVVGLGAFGILVRITFDIQPGFRMRQDVFDALRWDVFLADLDAVTAAAYSVSVFTDWQGDTLGQVWLKTRLADGDDTMPTVADGFAGATRRTESGARLIEGSDDNLTVQGGVPGPWSERLPHFRFDSVPSKGDEIQSEYLLPRGCGADALEAVRALRDRISPLLLISELRTVAADELWLSPAYQRDSLGIHFTWRNDPAAVAPMVRLIEEALAFCDARPHWAKLHCFDAADIERVTPRIADAREAFARRDPDTRFSGPHLERLAVTHRRSGSDAVARQVRRVP